MGDFLRLIPDSRENSSGIPKRFFNALNHANFSNPTANLISPAFGQIVSAGTARQIQLAIKFSFSVAELGGSHPFRRKAMIALRPPAASRGELMLRRKTLTSQVIDHVVEIIGRARSSRASGFRRKPNSPKALESAGRVSGRPSSRLESLGLVSVRQRIGAVVLEPSASNLLNAQQFSVAIQSQQTDDLLEFRKIMEVGLASLAAEKAHDSDIALLKDALDRYRAEMVTNGSGLQYGPFVPRRIGTGVEKPNRCSWFGRCFLSCSRPSFVADDHIAARLRGHPAGSRTDLPGHQKPRSPESARGNAKPPREC